ncbi:MAG: endonuclease MutS2 [Lachnospiraceae bacterium]|nr:endonuclease MutS2 [Lachnospiraceae bacterium]
MNDKVLHTLEFDKITGFLADKCTSEAAKQRALALRPFERIEEVERAQEETAEALELIFARGSLGFRGLKDVRPSVKRSQSGGVLTASELMHIASLLELSGRVRNYPGESEALLKLLRDRFFCLEALPSLSGEIRRVIQDENEIADSASPALASIRRKMKSRAESIHSTLQSLIRGSLKDYLMDAVITMRDNRYCIPVRAEHKSNVPGMVHDMSSTGSTLFIEPQAIVNLNNEIRELERAEEEEIQRILMALSAKVAECAEVCLADEEILKELDFIFARAELALDMDAMRPVFNTGGIINLRGARHPLLDRKTAVPIDLHLGDEFDLLIVTGPNTGGKTVALKTVGLLELMGLSGLHIPAKDLSELSFFREIYADIGDEQSIEQSLSTFSSHMKNVVEILKQANIMSLCLFDELGAGTDPTEGAALAEAIVSYLHQRSIRTIATTHYAELKEYALTTNWVENACLEFDPVTLSPTYRILVGVPGKSNAFAISSRLGLPDRIIENAEKLMAEEDQRLEKLMDNLEESRLFLEQEKQALSEKREELEKREQKLSGTEKNLEESKEKILAGARAEAKELLEEAKATADETIRRMQRFADTDTLRAAEEARSRVRESLKRTYPENGKGDISVFETAPAAGGLDPKTVKKGDSVRVLSLNLKGTVNSVPDAKGYLFVQCGIINNKVHVSDLAPDSSSPAQAARTSARGLSHASTISPELMLIGKRQDEAISELESYLDDAYMSHISPVRIVHGKGTGALRDAVRKYLKKCRYVKSFRAGEFGEGDAGVTIVDFK